MGACITTTSRGVVRVFFRAAQAAFAVLRALDSRFLNLGQVRL